MLLYTCLLCACLPGAALQCLRSNAADVFAFCFSSRHSWLGQTHIYTSSAFADARSFALNFSDDVTKSRVGNTCFRRWFKVVFSEMNQRRVCMWNYFSLRNKRKRKDKRKAYRYLSGHRFTLLKSPSLSIFFSRMSCCCLDARELF